MVCLMDRVSCLCVSSSGRDELAREEVVVGKGARKSFTVPSTFRFSAFIVCVGSDISSFRSSSIVRGGFASEKRSSVKPRCVRAPVATGVEPLVCAWCNTNNSAVVHRRRRSMAMRTDMESRGCVSLRLFLSFSKPINFDLPFHPNSCSPARGSLQYKTMLPTC